MNLGQSVVDEGVEKGRLKIAMDMLKDGVANDIIIKYTQFSMDELKSIEQDMARGKVLYTEEIDDKESIDKFVQQKLKILKEEYGIEFDEQGIEAFQSMHELHPQLIKGGENQCRMDVAWAMFKDGIDAAFITKYTQLSIEEIKKAKDKDKSAKE